MNTSNKILIISIFIASVFLLSISCAEGVLPESSMLEKSASTDFPIAITNQGAGRIQVFDSQFTNWNTSSALLWSWYPNSTNGFSASTPGWGAPSDVKLRNSSFFGGQVMAVADSRGFCALIPYPAGDTKYWSANVGLPGAGLNNLHAIELLPDGNTAVAASNGNYVRIYTSSQGVNSSNYVSFTLTDAHGLLWDPANNVLWALGGSVLTALEITGTAAAPIITEKAAFRVSLPSAGGHDLYAYYGDNNILWVTTHYGVYQFDKTGKIFTAVSGAAFGTAVKSIGNQPSGQIVQARPSTCTDGWNTNTVQYYNPSLSHTVTGACFYKARVWWHEYQ